MRIRSAFILAVLVALTARDGAQNQVTPSRGPGVDWPHYNGDLMGTRHSTLTQITPTNVSRLRAAWSYALGRDETSGTLSGGSELTPLVLDGVMYVLTAKSVVALAADTGKETWRHDVPGGVPSRRGLGYWSGDGSHEPRLIVTSGRRMVAVDAATGEASTGFGKAGVIDIDRPYNGSTTIYKNLAIIGTNAAPGAVRAYDVRTGQQRWEFQSVPRDASSPGHETWERDS